MLTLTLEQLGFIVAKAREYAAEVAPMEDAPALTEHEHTILDATIDNPTRQELIEAIRALNNDQRVEVIAMMWLGRGDAAASEWPQLIRLARERHNSRDAEYLAGTPLLADYLEEGAAALGYSLEGLES
jgi:hypothetical protein